MPVSRHRKKPFRTRREDQRRRDLMDKQAEARREIYERALPEKQNYQPFVYQNLGEDPAFQGEG